VNKDYHIQKKMGRTYDEWACDFLKYCLVRSTEVWERKVHRGTEIQAGKICSVNNNSAANCWTVLKFITWAHRGSAKVAELLNLWAGASWASWLKPSTTGKMDSLKLQCTAIAMFSSW